jgi:hypothetical protein
MCHVCLRWNPTNGCQPKKRLTVIQIQPNITAPPPQDLTALAAAGHDAACLFVAQRGDVAAFAPCFEKDPVYAELLVQAAAAGACLRVCVWGGVLFSCGWWRGGCVGDKHVNGVHNSTHHTECIKPQKQTNRPLSPARQASRWWLCPATCGRAPTRRASRWRLLTCRCSSATSGSRREAGGGLRREAGAAGFRGGRLG